MEIIYAKVLIKKWREKFPVLGVVSRAMLIWGQVCRDTVWTVRPHDPAPRCQVSRRPDQGREKSLSVKSPGEKFSHSHPFSENLRPIYNESCFNFNILSRSFNNLHIYQIIVNSLGRLNCFRFDRPELSLLA